MSQRARWAVAGIYALVVGLMTLPASVSLNSRLIGNNVDNWIFFWNNWQLEHAILEGQSWFRSPLIFYPQGASLALHSNSFLNSLLALFLKPLVGPVAAFNLVVLFGLWIGAVGMFLLVYDLTQRVPAGFAAGFLFAFAPYHVSKALAQGHLGSIHWWPFYVMFLLRALRRGRATDALWAGLFAALTVWSGPQLALLLALWTVCCIGWHLLRNDERSPGGERRVLRAASVAGIVVVVALLLSTPVLVPVAREWRQLPGSSARFEEGEQMQTDLLAYLVPPTYHPVVGRQVVPIYRRFGANKADMAYLGYAALALALVGLNSRRRRSSLIWLLSGALWMSLAAGPTLLLNGVPYPNIPMPYRLVGTVFPVSAIRAPDRFNLLAVLSLSVAAGIGAAYLWERRRWILGVLGLLALSEYLCSPLPMWELPPASHFYEVMAQDEADYGVVDYPMGYTNSKMWLYHQTLHGKPMVEGHISRYTPEDYAYISSQPLLQALYQSAEWPIRVPPTQFSGAQVPLPRLGPALRSLATDDVRYVLVHKSGLDSTVREHFRRVLPILPIYQDQALAVYDLARPLPVYYDRFPIPLARGVTLARFDAQYDPQTETWGFQILAALGIPFDSSLQCELELIGQSGSHSVAPVVFFEEHPQDGAGWQDGDLDVKEVTAPLPTDLASGTFRWGLVCPEESSYTASDTLTVYPDGHFSYLRRSVGVRYGEDLRLDGYRWRTEGSDLYLELQWEALEEPGADYKVFVHMLDAAGEIVAQHDAVPCNWQCPTSGWSAGDSVSDRAILSLAGLPPGEYRLAVGLYQEDTMERLPAHGEGGAFYPDGYFVAPDAFLISAEPASALEGSSRSGWLAAGILQRRS